MRLRPHGKAIVCADIKSPETIVAECKDLTYKAISDIVLHNNFGEEVFLLYKELRNDMHFNNVCKFLEKLDDLYCDYTVKKECQKFINE